MCCLRHRPWNRSDRPWAHLHDAAAQDYFYTVLLRAVVRKGGSALAGTQPRQSLAASEFLRNPSDICYHICGGIQALFQCCT